jgi:hypothetical protein
MDSSERAPTKGDRLVLRIWYPSHVIALTIHSVTQRTSPFPVEEKRGHESLSVGCLSSSKILFGTRPVNGTYQRLATRSPGYSTYDNIFEVLR